MCARDAQVWVISANADLSQRLLDLLKKEKHHVQIVDPDTLGDDNLSRLPSAQLKLIILDVDHNVARGMQIIQRIKRARIKAPMVVLTEEFSRDFGANILSAGVQYYLSYDFCESEFIDLTQTLLSSEPK